MIYMFINPKASFVKCYAKQICNQFKTYTVTGKEDVSKGRWGDVITAPIIDIANLKKGLRAL